MRRISLLFWMALCAGPAPAHDGQAVARYIANAGVMIAHGDTRILFDPLFRESFGEYRLPPAELRAAMFAGEAPWDGVDAVFISHYHDDHFEPAELVDYLAAQPAVRLFAPAQAFAALEAAAAGRPAVLERITAVSLDVGDGAFTVELPGLAIEALRVPHAGWPSRLTDVENLAWRVTLDDGPTVVHLGDADTREVHFTNDAEYWEEIRPHLALPPYWYFLSASGQRVLEEILRPAHAVGIHVPDSVPETPDAREEGLRRVDLFQRPGETRRIPH